jgi:hypothetical protein
VPDCASSHTGSPENWPAETIPVASARLTLLWPLAIQTPQPPVNGRSVADAVADCAARLARNKDGDWTPESDLARHIERRAGDEQWDYDVYAEGVYFHDFAQSFLFSSKNDDNAPQPLWLFRRRDVKRLDVTWGEKNEKQAAFDVERVNLYLFRTGAAILVVELSLQAKGKTLADVEDLHDILRRAYHPYGVVNTSGVAGMSHLVPRGVTWTWTDETRPAAVFDTQGDLEEIPAKFGATGVSKRRHTPIFAHWRHLLAEDLPLQGYESECKSRSEKEGVWRQVMDERMPTMLTLSVTAKDEPKNRFLRAIRRGDFARLCFADGSNSRAASTAPERDYPYDPDFLAGFEARHAYDRFASQGTRYFICGYAFVAVGAGDAIDGYVAMHMRRHYFQMNLIVNLEKATLLSFSSQVSDAARRYESAGKIEDFRKEMRAINEAFLQFVHRFRFTGVTNQMQGVEIFDMLRREADVNRLYEDVRGEIESANQYLFNRDQADAARESSRAADAANRLGRVAAAGVVAAMVAGLLGMNVLAQPELFTFLPGAFYGSQEKLNLFGHLLLFLLVSGGVLMIGASVVARIAKGVDRTTNGDAAQDASLGSLLPYIRRIGRCAWVIAAAIFLVGWLSTLGRGP